MHLIHPFEMIWQWFTAVLALGRLRVRTLLCLLRVSGGLDLCIFREVEGQMIKSLRIGTEARFLMPCQLALQLLDLVGQGLDLGCHQLTNCAQFDGIFGQ